VGKDPAAIREEIETTRQEMGDTIEAIGYKTDVKARAGDFVSEKKEAVTGAVTGVKDKVTSGVTRVTPSREDVRHGAQRVSSTAQQNPVGMAVGAAAVGFLVGMLVPRTRVEDERLGEVSDDLKSRVGEAGQEAIERGKNVLGEAAQQAKETVVERGKEESQDLASNLRDRAGETMSSGGNGGETPSGSDGSESSSWPSSSSQGGSSSQRSGGLEPPAGQPQSSSPQQGQAGSRSWEPESPA
jgi:hypothetical protein